MRVFIFIYKVLSKLTYALLHGIAIFNPKLKKGIKGRKETLDKIRAFRSKNINKVIWFHCASLGEFEQAMPLIEWIRENKKKHAIAVSFFSPSGYEPNKNNPLLDIAFYLPFDTSKNLTKLIKILNPEKVYVVKYEFWYNFLNNIHHFKIPLYLISAYFLPEQIFFKKYGFFHRKMLHFFNHIFVQDKDSKKLLENIKITNVSIVGDTRIDRAITTKNNQVKLLHIEQWQDPKKKTIIAGSTWKEDIKLLSTTQLSSTDYQWIIAPHNINNEEISYIKKQFNSWEICLWTEVAHQNSIPQNKNLIILNTIGILKSIYQYADIVWIGGGFNKSGIHNCIEAAVFNKALFWGPNYSRFKEAKDLIRLQGAYSLSTNVAFEEKIRNSAQIKNQEEIVGLYIHAQKGATASIVAFTES